MSRNSGSSFEKRTNTQCVGKDKGFLIEWPNIQHPYQLNVYITSFCFPLHSNWAYTPLSFQTKRCITLAGQHFTSANLGPFKQCVKCKLFDSWCQYKSKSSHVYFIPLTHNLQEILSVLPSQWDTCFFPRPFAPLNT